MLFSVAIVPGSISAVISGPIQSAPLRTDLATPEYCSDGAVRSLSFLRRDHAATSHSARMGMTDSPNNVR